MTQYFDGRRGTFWQGSPNGSVAAQWACPLPAPGWAVGLPGLAALGAARLAGLEAALRAALALPPLLGAFLGAARLPAFFAALRDLAGLMQTCRAIPGRP